MMRETFLYKFAYWTAFSFYVFGASAFVLTVLALCGVEVNFWIGVLSVIPGSLMLFGLAKLFAREQDKMNDSIRKEEEKRSFNNEQEGDQ